MTHLSINFLPVGDDIGIKLLDVFLCAQRVSYIPFESTFSRAFAEFAKSGLGDRVHNALVEGRLKPKPIGHISRDSTVIEGRKKPVKKTPKEKAASRKRGRPAKGERREPKEQNLIAVNYHQQTASAAKMVMLEPGGHVLPMEA